MFREELHGDVKPRFIPTLDVLQSLHRATDADLPFMEALATEKYPGRPVKQGQPWVEWCMKNEDRLVLVGPNSFGIAQAQWIYGFERRGRLDMICARTTARSSFEPLRMIRLMVDWAKARGCVGTFKIDADTGVNFTPFAARLGGYAVTVERCEIPL